MSVRNCGELGKNLKKIANRLLANDKLVNLLYYADDDPINKPMLTEEQKLHDVFINLIKVVPLFNANSKSQSMISIHVTEGIINNNDEFRDITINIGVLVPLSTWIINDDNLRPYAIIGEIQRSLLHKKINGLGEIEGGDFRLLNVTDEYALYEISYIITDYD